MATMNTLHEKTQKRFTEPCIITIFGATGDLTARKLIPAIYELLKEGLLPSQFVCIGFARRVKTDQEFRQEMRLAIQEFSRSKPLDQEVWAHFENHLFYHEAAFPELEGYHRLKKTLQELDVKFGTKGNRIFYLATPPSYFPLICDNLKKSDLIYDEDDVSPWSRVIIEKPFGHDFPSASNLQKSLLLSLKEDQIYRIDHWLGKETVQNLLVFRFANSIFESLWNNRYIDHIQVTVAEDLGIGTRGLFWEETGLLRDIVQNHVMQLLSLIAMEPPVTLDAEAIRNEKVKVLQAMRPLTPENIIRAQYASGIIHEQEVLSYREEKSVDPLSSVETYCALKLHIDNWRWADVPFYIRAGKRLPKKTTEVAIIFKNAPSILFQQDAAKNSPNVLVLRIQPDESISLKMHCKVPGLTHALQPVKMDFKYGSYFGMTPPEAYERLIYDAIMGDSTLFASQDEVLLSWKLFSPVLDLWKEQKSDALFTYPAGSWGPKEADDLLERDGKKWRVV
ncbi:MAG: glucose-6-phosphate dehydrogenase [Candidatus Rhabdochlamydia sp.]